MKRGGCYCQQGTENNYAYVHTYIIISIFGSSWTDYLKGFVFLAVQILNLFGALICQLSHLTKPYFVTGAWAWGIVICDYEVEQRGGNHKSLDRFPDPHQLTRG